MRDRCLHLVLLVTGALCSTCLADGLPGEYLLSSRWRDLLWTHSPLANPALLTDANFVTAYGAFSPVMQGAFRLWEAGVTVPLGMRHTAGISVVGENDGEIDNTVFDETAGRLVTGGETSSNNNVFAALAYAFKPMDRLSIGANLNTAYQTNFGEPVMGTGLDLGCAYRILESNRAGTHTLGLSTVNLLAPSMGSSLAPHFGNAGEYSRDLRLSWIGVFWDQRILGGLDLDMRDFFAQASEFGSGDSAGAPSQIEWGVASRCGAWIARVLLVYFQLGFDEHAVEYWGFAGGVKYPFSRDGKTVTTMYQYNIKTEGRLASAHTIYLMLNFGKSRNELWAKRREAPSRQQQPARHGIESLRKVRGLDVQEEQEYIRITAEEIAIRFHSGSAEVPPEAVGALQEIAAFLRTYPDHAVRIEGHTDSDPITGRLKLRYRDNTELSQARADAVKEYFVDIEQLPERLFTARGLGEKEPIAPNDTPANKYKNRRVVVTIRK